MQEMLEVRLKENTLHANNDWIENIVSNENLLLIMILFCAILTFI